ncbi:Ycf66 family protein [Corynebacterium pseudokroppenstedtii]|uniref:Ycf66 family protein n=1 Tax=Corynebacterium pseudokroppenstedtii TaxID=2804917 RepID=A0AAU0PZ80_9CORY|nr:Ycf66 family protein [Corynebacterium pseudokroppenstedtii]MBY0791423.1 hypothetical protein [Corynebacterium pseudokroppenstedtii]MCF6794040.1 Ycf66 family protein [Corynebacterium pseudokroppenstedtii]MCF8703438.1 Ycf66 family protein [Corynebacterium pseudokroppenstedtii]MCG2637028.1 Ycf66 family protein [Corynebacterium pseudokroppenstedtii]
MARERGTGRNRVTSHSSVASHIRLSAMDDSLEPDDADARPSRWHILHEAVTPALKIPGRMWAYVRTSPGRLAIMTTVLVIAIIAAGGALTYTSSNRQDRLNNLVKNTEPLSNAAQRLYGSLSVADSTATIGFLEGGVGSQSEDERYTTAIQTASTALVEAGAGANSDDHEVLQLLAVVNQRLPIYTGLIAQARTNNREGNPIGASYLTEASAIMQNSIIPAASRLYTITSDRVRHQAKSLTRPMWFPASGLLAAIILLVIGQLWLAALTNRRLNGGLLFATAAMTIALFWLAISSIVIVAVGNADFNRASDPLHELTASRISAQKARTDEALMLVRRSADQSSADFSTTVSDVQKTLTQLKDNGTLDDVDDNENSSTTKPADALDDAIVAANSWKVSHQELANRISRGDYTGAVNIAVGHDESTLNSERQFIQLDQSLRTLIQDTRSNLRTYLENSQDTSQNITRAVLILSVLSVVGVLIGVRPRMQEYT